MALRAKATARIKKNQVFKKIQMFEKIYLFIVSGARAPKISRLMNFKSHPGTSSFIYLLYSIFPSTVYHTSFDASFSSSLSVLG